MDEKTIQFKKVSKSYNGKDYVIKGIDLTIPAGQRTILLGPSGCGKTTLLRMISGLEDITDGELWMGNRVVNDVEPGDRNVSMVFQNYALYPHMTVEKNILFGLEVAKVPKEEREERLTWALEMLGLSEYRKRYPRELSGGQRQRVALCRALVKKAPFFLLDEPLSNLDAQLRTMARAELVKMHNAYHPTFVYVTHDQIEAMTVGQKIVVLHDGVIQQYDSPNVVYHQPKNVFVAKFIGSPSMNVIDATIEEGALVVGDARVAIPDEWKPFLGDRKEIKFGMRPEHITLSPESGDIKVKITYVENHGDKKSMAYDIAGQTWMATQSAHFRTAETMFIQIDWTKVHFFDFETTENVGYPESVIKENTAMPEIDVLSGGSGTETPAAAEAATEE